MDFAASLRRHYVTFLAVLVIGIVLIIVCDGGSGAAALYVDCALGAAGLLSVYALAPPGVPPRHPRRG
ncbi:MULTISPECIES: hypothetical protein [Streptomyces]|uniref:Integral membrane protein n=1 Tax=Streptomyces caniscabiei TaxID=2746961 RepID=A0ABU4N0T1_9ACTN|nr:MULTISPECIES: hypothetical protein [Streptomyces]MBE4736847.1 hypothetical protein [Streptomyces caniscabiei]MBE4762070.1 hypothetical protein [Streptomyces caniscabiei]MBE4775419.1 hypothetical protein [Streptomyces caniscabiei]MBE4787036.1 hypothetical protein [Streptomyces caniscabiei]MBE4794709.1 hypothetical protein [Streptomyces caniscabiei]